VSGSQFLRSILCVYFYGPSLEQKQIKITQLQQLVLKEYYTRRLKEYSYSNKVATKCRQLYIRENYNSKNSRLYCTSTIDYVQGCHSK